jgi:hypothetical protein
LHEHILEHRFGRHHPAPCLRFKFGHPVELHERLQNKRLALVALSGFERVIAIFEESAARQADACQLPRRIQLLNMPRSAQLLQPLRDHILEQRSFAHAGNLGEMRERSDAGRRCDMTASCELFRKLATSKSA